MWAQATSAVVLSQQAVWRATKPIKPRTTQTTGAVLDELENRYIKAAGGACQKVVQSAAAGHTGSDNKITLQQVCSVVFARARVCACAVLAAVALCARRTRLQSWVRGVGARWGGCSLAAAQPRNPRCLGCGTFWQ
jgi:hypothetical protein